MKKPTSISCRLLRASSKLLFFVLLIVLSACNDKWEEHFKPDSDDPFGVSFLPKILENRFPNAELKKLNKSDDFQELLQPDVENAMFIVVAESSYFTLTQRANLAAFIQKGNTVCIAARNFGQPILAGQTNRENTYLGYFEDDDELSLKDVNGREICRVFPHSKYGKEKGYFSLFDKHSEHAIWSVYNTRSEENKGLLLWYQVEEGGQMFLLSEPKVLSNIMATDSTGRILISQLLNTVSNDPSIIFYDKLRGEAKAQEEYNNNSSPNNVGENLFREIHKSKYLSLAWYTIFAAIILFLVFGTKRKQREIPVVHPPENLTIKHLDDLSLLYKNDADHNIIAAKQLRLFEHFCSKRFSLSPFQIQGDFDKLKNIFKNENQQLDFIFRTYRKVKSNNETISAETLLTLISNLKAIYKALR